MSTPLQDLDDAIHTFLNATSQGDKAINGWILGVSTSRIQIEDDEALPLMSGQRYALGPQTTVTDAAGLARYLSVIIENAMLEADDE